MDGYIKNALEISKSYFGYQPMSHEPSKRLKATFLSFGLLPTACGSVQCTRTRSFQYSSILVP